MKHDYDVVREGYVISKNKKCYWDFISTTIIKSEMSTLSIPGQFSKQAPVFWHFVLSILSWGSKKTLNLNTQQTVETQ